MKKVEQYLINDECERAYQYMCKELSKISAKDIAKSFHRLNKCQAEFCVTENFVILKSYDTIVACIYMKYNVGYDFLRMVYGYTATSAKHISKFFKQALVDEVYTWKAI